MRGVEHIHLGHCVWEGVEHIQYPRLRLVAMELHALERIRSHVHHVLLPRGFDEHSCARMNDNPVESVCDSEDTQVRQLVSDCEHLAHCQPCPRHRVRSDAQLHGVIITHVQTQRSLEMLHIRALQPPGPSRGTQVSQAQVPQPPPLSTYQGHSAPMLCLCQICCHQIDPAIPRPRAYHSAAMTVVWRDTAVLMSVHCLPHQSNAAYVGCPLYDLMYVLKHASQNWHKAS